MSNWMLINCEFILQNNFNRKVILQLYTVQSTYLNYKKVLLRERKRHTTRRVLSTHSVVLSWLTPPPQLADPLPPAGLTHPPSWTDPPWLDWPPRLADPPPWLDWHPPPAGLTPPLWADRQTRVKTLPSRRTTYAGGKNTLTSDEWKRQFFPVGTGT